MEMQGLKLQRDKLVITITPMESNKDLGITAWVCKYQVDYEGATVAFGLNFRTSPMWRDGKASLGRENLYSLISYVLANHHNLPDPVAGGLVLLGYEYDTEREFCDRCEQLLPIAEMDDNGMCLDCSHEFAQENRGERIPWEELD